MDDLKTFANADNELEGILAGLQEFSGIVTIEFDLDKCTNGKLDTDNSYKSC